MSEFTSEFELFTSVVDSSPFTPAWSSIDNALIDNDFDASTWHQDAEMELFLPKVQIPGGTPLLPTVVINSLNLQIRWARGGNVSSGGLVRLLGFNIGSGAIGDSFSSSTPLEPFHTDVVGGDLTFWGASQLDMHNFINGINPFSFRIETQGINGSTQTKVAWAKAQIQYTYTGSGIAFPRMF